MTKAMQEAFPTDTERVRRARRERLPRADLGNGTYRNPVLAGKYGDPSVVRVGTDYYLTHSGGGTPGVLIWHSRDLVNWRPLAKALRQSMDDVWAPELIHHQGTFYLYLPLAERLPDGSRRYSNVVCTASHPEGPWSDPVDLHVDGYIDPGHVVDRDGRRFLYFNNGYVVELAPDGLSTVGALKRVYAGWQYPDEWIVECMCLESPKLIERDGWFYLVSAQGGTSGPSTSHMIVVARSRNALGPWDNSPFNPMLRTKSRAERWWSQGHGTLIDDVDGNWWVMYHAYENGYRTLGRQTLLMPVEWTPDGWPRIQADHTSTDILPKPTGTDVGHGMPLSDDFESATLGLQWKHCDGPKSSSVLHSGGSELHMAARGKDIQDAAWIGCSPVHHAYEVQVEVIVPEGAEAGLLLNTQPRDLWAGAGLRDGLALTYWRSQPHSSTLYQGHRIFFRIRNLYHDMALCYSADGSEWSKFDRGMEVSSSFDRYYIGLYALGAGEVIFRQFRYHGLD